MKVEKDKERCVWDITEERLYVELFGVLIFAREGIRC